MAAFPIIALIFAKDDLEKQK